MIQILLAAGADMRLKDIYGDTAFRIGWFTFF